MEGRGGSQGEVGEGKLTPFISTEIHFQLIALTWLYFGRFVYRGLGRKRHSPDSNGEITEGKQEDGHLSEDRHGSQSASERR